jgi:hypothetical protein
MDVIAIDEAQFIPDLVSFCVAAADVHRKKAGPYYFLSPSQLNLSSSVPGPT